MHNPKIFLLLAFICFVLLALFGNLLFVWLGPFFLLLALVSELQSGHTIKRILADSTGFQTFKRVMMLCTALGKERIRIAWQRANITRLKSLTMAALACLLALAITGKELFIYLGLFFFWMTIVYALEDNARIKRAVVSYAGLRIMVAIETICLLIAVVSTMRAASYIRQLKSLIDDAQTRQELERLYQASREAEQLMGLFVSVPMAVIALCLLVMKSNKENPLVVEFKSTPAWKVQRVAGVALFLSNFGILFSRWLY